MPGGSKKGHAQGTYNVNDMKLAVRDVLVDNKSQKAVAKKYAISRQTLRRHVAKANEGKGVEKKLGRNAILSAEQEDELSNYVQVMEASLYGLTPMSVRKIVYRYCQENAIPNSFNHETKTAGRKWFRKVMARRKELSVRTPEPVSIQRAMGFNEPKVNLFMNILEKHLFHENGNGRRIPPENIFNVDETGISICHKPHKIVAKRGKKNVGGLTSAERGKNTTVVCCFSATGQYIPPFIIFPRVRMKESLMNHVPSGAVGRATKSGWINEDLLRNGLTTSLPLFNRSRDLILFY